MNLLLLPIPDEVLLEYLEPNDMESLAKVNTIFYKNYKPLIYKAVKKFAILRGGRFTEKILSFDFTKYNQFQFSHIEIVNYDKPSIYICYVIPRGYLSRDYITTHLFRFATTVLKDLNEMDENDHFDMSTAPVYNKIKTLQIDYARLHGSRGIQIFIDIYMVDEKYEKTGTKCSFEFFTDSDTLTHWPSTFMITPTYCII